MHINNQVFSSLYAKFLSNRKGFVAQIHLLKNYYVNLSIFPKEHQCAERTNSLNN